LIRASQDTRISLRARGVLATLIALDHIPPADLLWKTGFAGRDVVRSAYRELKLAGYIESERMFKNGQWITLQDFPTPDTSGVP
jgi:hypothetical protein